MSLRDRRVNTVGLLWKVFDGSRARRSRSRGNSMMCRAFADQLGITVASVDYRLAPEHPYPAAVDDGEAALRLLAARPHVDAARIAVGGASAGCGLAARLVQRFWDTSDLDVAFALLVYPMLDDRTAGPGSVDPATMRIWNLAANRFGWTSYLGGAEPTHAVPARRELLGPTPTWIGVGDANLFHDEDLAYADRLRAAGARVTVHVVPGAFHGFDALFPTKPVSPAFFAAQVAALRAALL